MRPLLTFAEETAELADFFRQPFGPDPLSKAASLIVTRASFDTLPSWARRLYGIRSATLISAIPKAVERQVTQQSARVLLGALRWSLGEPRIQIEARQRCLG
jgi:hypothetical protein